MNNGEKQNKKSGLRSFLKGLIALLCAVIIAGAAFGGTMLTKIEGLPQFDLFQPEPQYDPQDPDKFITNILITVQNQPLSYAAAKADMVFIVSFNAFEQKLTVAPLADSAIADGTNTFGEVYALKGIQGLMDAIKTNFNVDTEYYASTDTSSLGAMIDLLGGITARITRDEAEYLSRATGTDIRSGKVTMDGTLSMIHALDAISDARFTGALYRRLNLVESAMDSMRKTATKETMLPLLSLVFSNIKTNLDFNTLQNIGYEMLKADQMEFNGICIPKEGSYEVSPEDYQEIIIDMQVNGEYLREELYS